ncbi:MAG: hypothetical protein AAFZ52_01400 [Bacteroidota bacterium]
MRMLSLLFLLGLVTPLAGQPIFLLDDVKSGRNSSAPRFWAQLDAQRFLFAASPRGANIFPARPYISDGTAEGTVLLSEEVDVKTDFVRLGNIALFGGTRFPGGNELWITDGTPEGTELLADLNPGGDGSIPHDLRRLGDRIIFAATTPDAGRELWISDGTAAGTQMVADIFPGPGNGYDGGGVIIDDSLFYFRGIDVANNEEPWRSNGTADGTWQVADVNPGEVGSGADGFTKSGDWIYFSAISAGDGREPRRTDGTRGNHQLFELGTGTTDSSTPSEFTDVGGRLFFIADALPPAGTELWTSDHSGAPVVIAGSVEPAIFPRNLLAFRDSILFFSATDVANGRELWSSDGTDAGTQMIVDLYPGEFDGIFSGSGPEEFGLTDSLLYFAGADGTSSGAGGLELFATDGTAAGTRLIMDYEPGPQGSNPGLFFRFGSRLYFGASTADVGNEPHFIGPETPVAVTTVVTPDFRLDPPFPNPVTATGLTDLRLPLHLPRAQTVRLGVYDLTGRRVLGSSARQLPAGEHMLSLPLDYLSGGTYHLATEIGGRVTTYSFVVLP